MKQQFFARNGSKKKDKKILTLKLKMLFSIINCQVCTTSQDFYSFPVKVVILSYDTYFHETFLGRTKYVQDS